MEFVTPYVEHRNWIQILIIPLFLRGDGIGNRVRTNRVLLVVM